MTEKSTSDNSLNPKRKSFLRITIVTTQIMSTKEKKRKKILAVVTSDSRLFSQKKKNTKSSLNQKYISRPTSFIDGRLKYLQVEHFTKEVLSLLITKKINSDLNSNLGSKT